jgi:hypothetical protein
MRIATPLPYTELPVAEGNFDRTRATIDRVIIHTMDGTADGAAARFNDPASKVSAHYGVKLDGSLIHWLEETFTAYHAGDYAMNQRSIGIEHEDNGDYNGTRPDSLYNASGALVRDICQYYGIPIDRTHIRRHNEVSDAPTGCPDALDIDRIISIAQQNPSGTTTQTQLDDLRKERDDNWNLYQSALTTITDLKAQIEQLKQQPQPTAPVPEPQPTTPAYPDLSHDLILCQADSQQLNSHILAQNMIIDQVRDTANANIITWLLSQDKVRKLTTTGKV